MARLVWDEYLRQSDRMDCYATAVEQLKRIGRLYPCYETEQELHSWRGRRSAAKASRRVSIARRSSLRLRTANGSKRKGVSPRWRIPAARCGGLLERPRSGRDADTGW